jgi:beta-glucanase (GH16 family)
MKQPFLLRPVFFVILLTGSAHIGMTQNKTLADSAAAADWKEPAGMSLVWQDEFNGTAINISDWAYETVQTGWSPSWNKEWQRYTDNSTGGPNAFVEDGSLVIKADKTTGGDGGYTAARMVTRGKNHWTHGVIAASMKLPYGQGIWPAFWMLPEKGTWPNAGEIDIMELIGGGAGRDNKMYGTLHGPGYSGAKGIQGSCTLSRKNFSDAYHVFEIRWSTGKIEWYVDGQPYHTATKTSVPGAWPFDDGDFYILFNLAVGGSWPGYPDAKTVFPQSMSIDWVRVYQ